MVHLQKNNFPLTFPYKSRGCPKSLIQYLQATPTNSPYVRGSWRGSYLKYSFILFFLQYSHVTNKFRRITFFI